MVHNLFCTYFVHHKVCEIWVGNAAGCPALLPTECWQPGSLSALRVLRVLRVARVLRLLRFFRPLWLLVIGAWREWNGYRWYTLYIYYVYYDMISNDIWYYMMIYTFIYEDIVSKCSTGMLEIWTWCSAGKRIIAFVSHGVVKSALRQSLSREYESLFFCIEQSVVACCHIWVSIANSLEIEAVVFFW